MKKIKLWKEFRKNTYKKQLKNRKNFIKDETIFILNGKVAREVQIILEEKDILIINGLVIKGRYLSNYKNTLGVFLWKNCGEPISWIFNNNIDVYINEYIGREKTVVIEFNNIVKEEEI